MDLEELIIALRETDHGSRDELPQSNAYSVKSNVPGSILRYVNRWLSLNCSVRPVEPPNRSKFVAIALTMPSNASILRHAGMRNPHETMPVAAAKGATARIGANQGTCETRRRGLGRVSRVSDSSQGACNVYGLPGNAADKESN